MSPEGSSGFHNIRKILNYGVTLGDVPVQGKELDSVILVGTFQLEIFHDSVILCIFIKMELEKGRKNKFLNLYYFLS